MNTKRPEWAETTMTIADPDMSDAEQETSPYLRVLTADFTWGTLSLRSAEDVDVTCSLWWPMPPIPAATIHEWLPEILPAVQTLCDAVTEINGHAAFPGTQAATQQINDAVDALHMTWLGRPAAHGLLAHCSQCRNKITLQVAGPNGTWLRDGASTEEEPAMHCWSGPSQLHVPFDDVDPGHTMLDLRPYHEWQWKPAGAENVTANCACGDWSTTGPTPVTEAELAYAHHTEAIPPAAPFDLPASAVPSSPRPSFED